VIFFADEAEKEILLNGDGVKVMPASDEDEPTDRYATHYPFLGIPGVMLNQYSMVA